MLRLAGAAALLFTFTLAGGCADQTAAPPGADRHGVVVLARTDTPVRTAATALFAEADRPLAHVEVRRDPVHGQFEALIEWRDQGTWVHVLHHPREARVRYFDGEREHLVQAFAMRGTLPAVARGLGVVGDSVAALDALAARGLDVPETVRDYVSRLEPLALEQREPEARAGEAQVAEVRVGAGQSPAAIACATEPTPHAVQMDVLLPAPSQAYDWTIFDDGDGDGWVKFKCDTGTDPVGMRIDLRCVDNAGVLGTAVSQPVSYTSATQTSSADMGSNQACILIDNQSSESPDKGTKIWLSGQYNRGALPGKCRPVGTRAAVNGGGCRGYMTGLYEHYGETSLDLPKNTSGLHPDAIQGGVLVSGEFHSCEEQDLGENDLAIGLYRAEIKYVSATCDAQLDMPLLPVKVDVAPPVPGVL